MKNNRVKNNSRLPSISIVTPSYNQGDFIEETINSVLSQNYPNLDYWVIDGGSKDSTIKILNKYKKHLNFVSQKDRGQTHAINKGIKKSSGEIFGYLNSDDVLQPNALLTVGQNFAQNPNIDWLTGDYSIVDKNGNNIQSFVTTYKSLLRMFPSQQTLAVANFIAQPSTFWKRSVFKKIGVFDQSLRYCMDYDFWFRLMNLSKPLIISDKLSQFRIHPQSKGGSAYDKQFAEEHEVAQRYFSNKVFLLMHKLHASGIVLAYRMIK